MQKYGDTDNEFLYTGEQYNANTGLYYLRARYMNPSTGTFISMDSYQGSIYDPVTLHKYLYANANPVTYTDPSGYSSDNTLVGQETNLAMEGIIATAFVFANQVSLNIFSDLRKNMATAVTSLECTVSVLDWKNVIVGFPAHQFDNQWIVTMPTILLSAHLFKAIYEIEEVENEVETPGVPEEEVKENEETDGKNEKSNNKKEKKPTSPNQMDQKVKKGQAPKEVEGVHNPDEKYSQPHVHFKDGTSITIDGKVHDAHKGSPKLTNKVLKWLHDNGWCLDLD